MGKEKIKKLKDTILNFFVLSLIQLLISLITSSVGTTIVVVIIMPETSLISALLLGIVVWAMLFSLSVLGMHWYNKGKEIELLEDLRAQKQREMQSKRLKEAFRDVKLSEIDDTCEYSQNPTWLKIPEVRKYLENHEAWELWEKIEPAEKYYKEVEKVVRRELAQIVDRDVWDKVSFDIGPWSVNKGDIPSKYYWCEFSDGEYTNYTLMDAIINKFRLYDTDQDGVIMLYGRTGCIAKTATKSESEELKRLIIAMMTADETKKLVKKVNDAKDAAESAEKAFKKKLARIVLDLNYRAGGRA